MPNRPITSRPLPDTPLSFLMRYIRAPPMAVRRAVQRDRGRGRLRRARAVRHEAAGRRHGRSADRATADVWTPLALFLGLIAVENVLWRLGGWLGCRTIVATGVDMRLDLFQHLTGHPMRYFSQHFAGSLGSRITATANAGRHDPAQPDLEHRAALHRASSAPSIVLTTIDWRMAVALACFVAIVALRHRLVRRARAGSPPRLRRIRRRAPAASWSMSCPTSGRSRRSPPASASATGWPGELGVEAATETPELDVSGEGAPAPRRLPVDHGRLHAALGDHALAGGHASRRATS